jgi:PqqD family protein of HPr-rel-A system
VSLAWREWDPEEAVVFNRASGRTHLLDAFSAAALRALSEQPQDIATLSHDLVAQSGAPEDSVTVRLRQVLNTLRELGLAEPIPLCVSAS